MLDYDSFKKIVEESIMDYIPDRDNYQVNIHPVMKSNGKIYDGMCLIPNNPEASILPTVYLNTMYDTYQVTERLDDIIKNTASILMDSKQKLLDNGVETLECNPLDLICGDNAKSKVIFSLVNTDANSEMLSDMPSREFQDLSVIYKLYLSDLSNGGYATININNKIADIMGVSERELHDLAMINTRNILPTKVIPMIDIIKNYVPEFMAASLEQMPPDEQMYIITNDKASLGAVNILYKDSLDKIADITGTDLYLIPSSTQEMIAVSTNLGTPDKVADMVYEVNQDAVREEERLSNQVYKYDAKTREISIASDASIHRDIKDAPENTNNVEYDQQPRRHRGR